MSLTLSPGEVGNWLTSGSRSQKSHVAEELALCRRFEETKTKEGRELPSDVDPHDLSQAGWGVIFPEGGEEKLANALKPLLERRQAQAEGLFQSLTYHRGESFAAFCARYKETLGTIRPETMPYYLMIVGEPTDISFNFQYHLSLNHAVGRLGLADVESYERYSRQVVEVEDGALRCTPETLFFSVEEDGDRAMSLLARYLVDPLYDSLQRHLKELDPSWQVEVRRRERATKSHLHEVLATAPGLLLVACHGLWTEPEYTDQELYQGALLCQAEADEGDRTYTAEDVAQDVDLRGQIALLFACFGAGTPRIDNFPNETSRGTPVVLAPRPFLARLPQALLTRGTLAVLGHVDRGWTLSFAWEESGVEETSAVASLEDAMKRLLGGSRLGHALRPLARRYTALAARLARSLDNQRIGVPPDPEQLGVLWTAVNDARNFVLLGDPAVYLTGRRRELSGTVQLDSELLPYVRKQASSQGMNVKEWINELVRIHAREGSSF